MLIRRTMIRVARLFSALVVVSCCAHGQDVSEYQIKALFLYNFLKFVEWPPDAFASSNHAIKVCIAGTDPFGQELDQAVKGKVINTRELMVRRVPKADDLQGCHALFVGAGDRKWVKQVLAQVAVNPILTINDMDGPGDPGTMISLFMEGRKVRFDINLDAAERVRLKISSKLLSLARTVKEPGK